MSVRETFVELDGRKIWCGVYGQPSVRPPLLCIPGGPGASHHYLQPLAGLTPDRQVVFYDALGSGRSGRPAMAWTEDVYAAEVNAVVRGLGLERYHLFVHSAASLAGLVHAAGHPPGLRALILSGTPVSYPAHHTYVRSLLARMMSPPDLAAFLRAELDPALRDVAHARIAATFVAQHACLVRPVPRVLIEATIHFNQDARQMMKGGVTLFTTELGRWDFTDRLGEIAAPTLLTYGRYDILPPEVCEDVARRIPSCELHMFGKSSHMPHLEEPEAHLERVGRFLALHD